MASVFQMEKMTVEILSLSDGKEGIAKAASFLCSKYMKDDSVSCNKSEPAFTESDVANALNAVGMHFHIVHSGYMAVSIPPYSFLVYSSSFVLP